MPCRKSDTILRFSLLIQCLPTFNLPWHTVEFIRFKLVILFFIDSCTKHPVFENLISECNPAYSWTDEETGQYSAGWKPPLNKTATRKLRHRKRKAYYLGLENPWQYQSVLKLKNFPFLGKFATYSGSSYAASIGPDARIAGLIIKSKFVI